MGKARLEAFSDGVIAILITIMVLEFKTPEGHEWAALGALWPKFSAYLLSFVFLGIYWNNHHHMFHVAPKVTGAILWANLHLLFWLSLVPFTTAWVGETHVAPLPTALYGVVLLLSGVAFTILVRLIIASQGQQSPLKAAVGSDRKGTLSILMYAVAIPIAFAYPWISAAIYTAVALIWLIPDRRIEKHLAQLELG
jgi:TMEM175 potassium channel family protein